MHPYYFEKTKIVSKDIKKKNNYICRLPNIFRRFFLDTVIVTQWWKKKEKKKEGSRALVLKNKI